MNDKAKIDALRAALEAIEHRIALTYSLCCGLAPKQAVGELLDVTRNMPEWGILRTALTADASEQALDRRRCKPCAATRGGDNCWKCGTATFEPHPSCGDDPALPPIDRIRELAKEVGYAVGVHGSQQRDLDVIAAPWTDAAIGNYALMEHIAKGLTTDNGPAHIISTERKPLGRYAATIQMDGWYKQLDISVCAAAPAAPVADTGAVADAERIAHLEGEEEISEAVIATMSRLLASIAITLKGEEAALRRHSYHDLAELVKVMALELDLYKTIYGEKVPEGWDSATPASTATADILALSETQGQVEHVKRAEGVADRFDAFLLWAGEHLGQGYSLETFEGTFTDKVTRWAFVAYKAGIKQGQQAGAVDREAT